MNKLKVLELFGGIGAPRKALENILGVDKHKTIDYVEILDYATAAYNSLYNNNYKPQSVVGWDNNPDIVIHGSPCQDFSMVGLRKGGVKGTETRSSLMWETIHIVENVLAKKPKVVIWENVKGVLQGKMRATFDKYLTKMESIGYTNNYEVLSGLDIGIPQTRERVFVVSVLKGQTMFNNNFTFKHIKKYHNKQISKSKIEYINDPTTKKLSDYLESNVGKEYFIKQPSMIKAIQNKKISVIDGVANTITTKQWRWNNSGVIKIPLTTFNQENYIRLPHKAVADTITASGANSRQKIAIPATKPIKDIPVFLIDGKPYHLRILTERECWRLMGFKDKDYDKINWIPKTKKYHLAGNSIIVPLLEEIFHELFNTTSL